MHHSNHCKCITLIIAESFPYPRIPDWLAPLNGALKMEPEIFSNPARLGLQFSRSPLNPSVPYCTDVGRFYCSLWSRDVLVSTVVTIPDTFWVFFSPDFGFKIKEMYDRTDNLFLDHEPNGIAFWSAIKRILSIQSYCFQLEKVKKSFH